MRIFITGVAGFLGSHLAERMIALGHEVVGVDSMIGGERDNIPSGIEFHEEDCCGFAAICGIVEGCHAVYHCAATAYEGLSVFSPHLVARNILDASVSVFSAAISHRVDRIVYCSSMARYGTNDVPFLETYKPRPQDPYGIFKVAAEQALRNLCEVHETEFVIAVPHNIIGPRQKFDDPFRNVASIMANLMLQGRAPIIYGDGTQMRCFSFVDECVECLVKMLDAPISGEVVNIGPDGEFVTINELCQTISRLVGFDGEPRYMPGRPQEVKFATCSADKARALLGYEPRTTLEEGLSTIVEHIRRVGTRPFDYHLDLEIINSKTPATWLDRLF